MEIVYRKNIMKAITKNYLPGCNINSMLIFNRSQARIRVYDKREFFEVRYLIKVTRTPRLELGSTTTVPRHSSGLTQFI